MTPFMVGDEPAIKTLLHFYLTNNFLSFSLLSSICSPVSWPRFVLPLPHDSPWPQLHTRSRSASHETSRQSCFRGSMSKPCRCRWAPSPAPHPGLSPNATRSRYAAVTMINYYYFLRSFVLNQNHWKTFQTLSHLMWSPLCSSRNGLVVL